MTALGVITALSLTSCGGCSDDDATTKGSSAEAVIGQEGAQHTINGVTVVAPKGAVAKDTTLTVSAPRKVDAKSAPLATSTRTPAAFQFDVSLDGGQVQPAKNAPLTIRIPTTGEFAPKGADPRNALVYTTLPNGKFALLDSKVENGQLVVTTPHLSPKTVTYLTTEDIEAMLESGALTEIGGDCKKSGAAPPMELLKITDDAPNGLVEACITTKKSNTFLTIRNRTPIMWGVKGSRGTEVIETQDSINDQAIKMLRGNLYDSKTPQGILVRDSYIDIKLNKARIPAKVEVRAHQRLVNAELVWKAFQLWVQIKSGKSKDEVYKDAERLLVDVPGLQECLGKIAGDTKLTDVPGLLFSTCADVIGKAMIKVMGEEAASWIMPKKWWNRIQTGGGAFMDGLGLFENQVTTAFAKFDDKKINITVDVANPCLSGQDFSRIGKRLYLSINPDTIEPSRVTSDHGIACRDGWALVHEMSVTADSYMGYKIAWGPMLLKKENGTWKAMGLYASPFDSGTDGGMIHKVKKGCNQAPKSFRYVVHC